MKTLLLTILLLPLFVLGQEVPKKGAKQIFITNDKTAEENFNYVSKYLVSEAVNIEGRDKDLGVISTETFSIPKLHPVALTFFCDDNTIRVTGKFKSGIEVKLGGVTSTDNWEPVTNKGMKGSIYNKAFKAMNEVSRKLEGEVTYK